MATLLFAHIAFGQSIVDEADATSSTVLDTPVVQNLSATGVVEYTGEVSSTTVATTSPAEMDVATSVDRFLPTTITELGALGTSDESQVVLAALAETEESTPISPKQQARLFDLVYGGFEEFVRVVLGWE